MAEQHVVGQMNIRLMAARPAVEFILVIGFLFALWLGYGFLQQYTRANDLRQQSLPVKAPGYYPTNPVHPTPKQEMFR